MAVALLATDAWVSVVIESLFGAVTGVVVVLECAVPVSCFVVNELSVDIAVKVVANVNVNVSAAVMDELEFSVSIL